MRKSVPAMPTTDSENATVNASDDAFVMRSLVLSPVSDDEFRDTEVTLGTVRSTVTLGVPEAVVAELPATSATPKDPEGAMPLEPLEPMATDDWPVNEHEFAPDVTAPTPEMFVSVKSDAVTVAQLRVSPADTVNATAVDRVGLAVVVDNETVGAVRSIVTVGADTASLVLVLSAVAWTDPDARVSTTVPALQPVTATSTGAASPLGVAMQPVAVLPAKEKSDDSSPVMFAEKVTS